MAAMKRLAASLAEERGWTVGYFLYTMSGSTHYFDEQPRQVAMELGKARMKQIELRLAKHKDRLSDDPNKDLFGFS